MKIYTSYFANMRNIKPDNITFISIARITPDWFDGISYQTLSPSYHLLSMYKHDKVSEADYRAIFFSKLSNLKWDSILYELENFAGDGDLCLLCYETPDKFCHRNIVSDWLNTHGIESKEITKDMIDIWN